jgi:hypothetical protein
LDNLAFSTPGLEMATEEDSATSDVNYQDERLHIDCAVNTSPGTSEVYLVRPLLDRLLSTCPSFYFFFFGADLLFQISANIFILSAITAYYTCGTVSKTKKAS